ncbi:MAG: NADH-quinone oxidoreductase subunit L [Xanthomonadales bacterium]|nr:NADH-quinone oxidoreductase subunit L [Gammaproteobacteria bacterium]MBT8052227.1 NADH-quinone oxidoreductase subunit L [Gammaproteobacteria bacterium]MBT8057027.1 NADH-quinone oxidoreductase subunit L [Gammaproteobacteria bacterium]NNJ80221.1 NADH-quinone oxidoreductase subunit L [Xanthomonadales bacterium]NNL05565.1 NADH-quinone oxidoreductase subunit L [Xanthomonadales bacterium]
MSLKTILILIPLLPLLAAAVAGLLRNQVGRAGSHWVTILGVAISFALSVYVLYLQMYQGLGTQNISVYTWMVADGIKFEIGFLIDHLSSLMMVVVSFISFMVHIYTIGYMADDPGYQRFFSYIALFTFSMLMLVMSNNFLQLFFGWEAVGLVSYLLIGFWFDRESAVYAGLKAFLVNRVGDFGFLLGIAAVLYCFGSMDYFEVFAAAPGIEGQSVSIIPGVEWQWITVICICLFIGAMGKSAQAPLHVWLPDSMEGPTPISALIHAATMVTAGIFMVARMSPLFELSEAALSFVMLIGALTAFFMGLVGIVQNDIKRVIAYSTLSQLGYMTVALGVSAYSAAIFHLGTHAFFKALLFLGAGSVIIALHHQQDMRYMGGLRKQMPITWITAWVGTLALIGFPFFAGFYSKDAIIEAVHASSRWGAGVAYWAVLLGVIVTSFYSFRLLYLTFHGKPRYTVDVGAGHHPPDGVLQHAPKESPLVVTVPLILLAIPSIVIGYLTIDPVLFTGWLSDSITVLPQNDVLAAVGEHFHGPTAMAQHALQTAPFWLMLGGFVLATLVYMVRPALAGTLAQRFPRLHALLENKFYVDELYQKLFIGNTLRIGNGLWKKADAGLIDGWLVNGSAKLVGSLSARVRTWQSGFLFQYAFAMIIGLIGILAIWVML